MQPLYRLTRIWSGVYLLVFLLCASSLRLTGQNLVPNHSFEDYDSCPLWPQLMEWLETPPWRSLGTANVFNSCADPMYLGVPNNFSGTQIAQDGVGYGGLYIQAGSGSHEYLQVKLLDTLEAGMCYKVSFWISLSEDACAADQIGALFTSDQIDWPNGEIPQIDYGGQFYGDYDEWMHILGYFTAFGDELYLTIGNFASNDQTAFDPECDHQFIYAYYYVDNVVVEKVPEEPVTIDLGPPVTVCDSFIIDPEGDPDVVYYWSTGAIGPTLTVYTTGVYSVTASYHCSEEVGVKEVTVINTPPLDIGPDAVILCNGDSYEINLDPDLGVYEWSDGSISPDFTITEPGTYHVALDDGCELFYDTIDVSYMDVPLDFSLGPDTFFCPGDAYIISLDPDLGEFEWQDGSDESIYTITNPGTYALTISNMCGQKEDDFEIITIQPPDISFGLDSANLCTGEIIDVEFDPDQGTYVWHDNSTFNYYSISSSGTYSVTVTNECGEASGSIVATFDNLPLVDLGPDIIACQGDTFTLTVGNNTGEIEWQDGSIADTFQVSSSGVYSVMVENACGFAEDMISINYAPPITPPDLGPDVVLCPGEEVILMANSAGPNYLWSDLSTADSLLVNSTGAYFVQVSSACESFSDTVQVTVTDAAPMVQLPDDFVLCEGESVIFDVMVPGGAYQWSNGSMLSQIVVSSPGTYAVTVSTTCGSSRDTVVVTAGDPLPTVDLGDDQEICPGETLTLTPVTTNVDTWMWSDGSAQSSLEIGEAGVFIVDVANACGVASDTITVTLLPEVPQLVLAADTIICPGETITLAITIPDVDILWYDGSVQNEVTIAEPTQVYATISTICGISSDTMMVSLHPETPELDLGDDQTICPGSVVTIGTNITGVSYVWQDGSTDPFFDATTGGEFFLTISDICGSSTDTIVLTEDPSGPQVNLGSDVVACEGEEVLLSANISGVEYLWQDGSDLSQLIVTLPGVYSVTVSNACGTDTDSINVVFNPLPPAQVFGPDTSLCDGEILMLTAVTSPGTNLMWQDGSIDTQFQVVTSGTYFVLATNGCGVKSDTIDVAYTSGPPNFTLGVDTILCEGETIVLEAPFGMYDLVWQDGSTSNEYLVTEDGTYMLTLSNPCGSTSDDIEVSYNTDRPLLDLDPQIIWCPGELITLDASQLISASYLWSTGETNPVIQVSAPGVYEVTVQAPCFETAGSTEILKDNDCPVGPVFYIPNVFSPDQNGTNDVFTVFTDLPDSVMAMEGSLFDRWGNLVFASQTNPFVWDGTFNGQDMMAGVYVYQIRITYVSFAGDIISEVFSGDVTLLR